MFESVKLRLSGAFLLVKEERNENFSRDILTDKKENFPKDSNFLPYIFDRL